MTKKSTPSVQQKAGLFLLRLQSETSTPGAPVLHLNLGVDAPHDKASGIAEVTQALAQPVVCTSSVSGPVIYETVMGPGSKIRIDLSGYPILHSPDGVGVLPVVPKNFKATVLLQPDWSSGEVTYQYQSTNGGWQSITQKISEVERQLTQVAA